MITCIPNLLLLICVRILLYLCIMNKQNPLLFPTQEALNLLNDVAQFCSIVDTLVKTVYRVNSHSLLCLQNSD